MSIFDDFVLLNCRIKQKFLAVIGLTTLEMYDKIELHCRHCGFTHTYTMLKSGKLKVVTQ